MMSWSYKRSFVAVVAAAAIFLCYSANAQQKPQWLPGQVGLNAGILPSPGFTYVNITANYSSGAFNGPNGSAIPVTGKYDVWAVENFFFYVPNLNVLHGNIGMYLILTPATGSLVADLADPESGHPQSQRRRGGRWACRSLCYSHRCGLAPEASGHPGAGGIDGSHGALYSRRFE